MSGFPLLFRTRGSFPVRCFPWKGGSGEKPPRWCSASWCPAPRRCVSQHCTSRWCTSWHCASRCCSSQCSTAEGCNTLVVQTPAGLQIPAVPCPGAVCPGALRPGAELPGMVLPSAVRPGAVRPGAPCPGAVRPGALCPGAVRPSIASPRISHPPAAGPGVLSGFPINTSCSQPVLASCPDIPHPDARPSTPGLLSMGLSCHQPLIWGEKMSVWGPNISPQLLFFFVGESCLKAPRAENPTVDFNRARRRACRNHWMQAMPVPGHLAPMPKAPG